LKLKKYKINLVPIPWKRGLNYIKKGKGFAIYPPYHRINERPYIWPYSLPMVNEEVILVCKSSIKKKEGMNWPIDFLGLNIGRNRGFSTGGPQWKELIKIKKIKDAEIDSLDQAIKMLVKKRLDCYMNDRNSIFWTFKKLSRKGKIKQKMPNFSEYAILSRERGFIGYSAKYSAPYKADFIKSMDHALHELRKNGEISRIIDKYIK
jgi:polar amino acid transport system substrate-binding protein